ncbi:Gfo/Idh/MocA family protein [Lacticaseibacillus sp. GG6-2]
MTRYNWGIIGLGRIARQFVAEFPDSQTLYGVAATDPARANAFASEYHIPHTYASYAELFADPAIDIVYVATTHNFHYANIKQALLAGKHVLAEKSITLNLKQLDELIAIAKQHHLILMEAQTIYHMPLYQRLAETTAKLGRLRAIQANFGSSIAPDPNDRLLNPELGGGALLDIGIYALSFVRRFMTATPRLVATQMIPANPGVDDQSTLFLTNDHNEQATVALNLQAKMPRFGLVTYDQAYLTVDDYPRAEMATLSRPTAHGVADSTLQEGDGEVRIRYEIDDMAEAVTTGANPTLAWTRDTMAIMSQAREAWDFYYPNEPHQLS